MRPTTRWRCATHRSTRSGFQCASFDDVSDVACWLHIGYHMELLTNLLHRIDKILYLDHETLADDYYLSQEAPLTLSVMSADGIYLVDNGQAFVVRIGHKR